MQPGMCALDDPARDAKTTAVFGAPTCDHRRNAAFHQSNAMGIGVVSAVGLQRLGPLLGAAHLACDRWNAVDQRYELSHIVVIRRGQYGSQRNALRLGEDVVLATRTTAIGWVRSSFFPAPTARIEELSAMAREKSNWSAPRNFASSVRCNRSHTRRRCHNRNRRQHVMPEPQPISLGNISQGMPDFNTNRIPVSTRRLHNGFRPVYRLRRCFFGKSGSISPHSSSSINGCDILTPRGYAMPHRTNAATKVQDSFC